MVPMATPDTFPRGRLCSALVARLRPRRVASLLLVVMMCCLVIIITTRHALYNDFDTHFEEEQQPCNESFGRSIEYNKAVISRYPLRGADDYLRKLGVFSTVATPTRHVPVIATAASSNHYFESLLLLENIERTVATIYPDIVVYYYDLGLTDSHKSKIQEFSFIQFRDFPFDEYPAHVRDLFGYTWKPIILQTLLQEFGFVMWADASVRFSNQRMDILFDRARDRGIVFRNGFYKIVVHTDGDTFKFLGEQICTFLEYNEIEANFLVIYRTQFVNDYVMKPLLSCALLDGCMVTRNSASLLTSCTTHARYGECHRFDQSVMSIILTRLYQDLSRYDIPPEVTIRICRGVDVPRAPDFINRAWYRLAYWYVHGDRCRT